ncbi:MAG: ankyrin repeat domain-containing protein, partial [bacterium]
MIALRIALLFALALPSGAVLADVAQDEALEALNRRNIRFSPEEFTDLVRNDDAENVRIFIQAGMNPNYGFADGSPALCIAATKGHTETARALLDGGALINSKDKEGYTPLMLTVLLGRAETALALLEKGADPNVQNRYGNTALIFAVQERRVPLVEALLKAKADAAI